jgi:hypothetical protein
MSGAWANYEKYGDWFSWSNTARANIFRRDQVCLSGVPESSTASIMFVFQVKVVDEPSFQRLLRYNDFTNDPLSRQVRVICTYVLLECALSLLVCRRAPTRRTPLRTPSQRVTI